MTVRGYKSPKTPWNPKLEEPPLLRWHMPRNTTQTEEVVRTMEAKKMTQEQMMKFKTIFENERNNLIYTQNLINENFHVSQDDLLDPTDFTTSVLETTMRMRLRSRETLYLKKIEEALRRISDGTFGECGECSQPIEPRRLQARPTATFCVTCKEEQERQELNHIDGHRPKSLGTKLNFA